jgi:hypothetical protein
MLKKFGFDCELAIDFLEIYKNAMIFVSGNEIGKRGRQMSENVTELVSITLRGRVEEERRFSKEERIQRFRKN